MAGTARFRATVAYDGTAYHGFQRQANASPTVQEVLEAALHRISGEAAGVVGAGRTDAGVHATGQVIAFDLDWRHSEQDLRSALNANLPADVVAREVEAAAPQCATAKRPAHGDKPPEAKGPRRGKAQRADAPDCHRYP